MSGLPYWDALIWAVVGLVGGYLLGRWATPRSPFILALICALAGAVLVPLVFLVQGADGVGPAISLMLATIPLTLGLVAGGAVARFLHKG